ncbi:MAG: trimeric intracellular cation channel family protein [Rhodospirillales bacterium]|nr:trimeric intracellular cation channel family protein [Rhodospirillales bacterium]
MQFLPGMDFLVAADHLAVAVFAISGALVASRKQMDIFGFVLLGTVTGVGGGTVRDLLLGDGAVNWVQEPSYAAVCIAAAAVTYFAAHLFHSRYRLILWLDALGLSLFCILGAEKALAVGAHPLVAVIMGIVTGTFGGIIRDVLGGEVPLILRKEIYVTAALAGAVAFAGLSLAGAGGLLAFGFGFLCCFTVRALAIRFGWSLPVYKAREGRDVS